MTEEMVMNLGTEALKIMLMLAGPMLLAAMIIGIVVSVFQAITQINEATLTFIPKMFAIVLVLAVMGPWMLKALEEYATTILGGSWEWIK